MYVAGLLKEGLHLDAVPDLPANELIQPLLLPQTGERLHILYVEVEEDAESTNAGPDKRRSCFYVLVSGTLLLSQGLLIARTPKVCKCSPYANASTSNHSYM